jgi:putative endonuclease
MCYQKAKEKPSKASEEALLRARKNTETARLGEQQTAGFLEQKDWTIVARNWRCRSLEIDLVAVRGTVLAFVEVKSSGRRPGAGGSFPLRQLRQDKRRSMAQAARCYLVAHPHRGEIRFDLVECWLPSSERPQFRHWEGFWTPDNWGLGRGPLNGFWQNTSEPDWEVPLSHETGTPNRPSGTP